MKLHSAKRMHNVKLHVDSEARPGWPTGHDRVPFVGEEVFCTMGTGEVTALHGKTSDGSRLLQIRLSAPGTAPFFAAASNVLVHPHPETATGPGPGPLSAGSEEWLS